MDSYQKAMSLAKFQEHDFKRLYASSYMRQHKLGNLYTPRKHCSLFSIVNTTETHYEVQLYKSLHVSPLGVSISANDGAAAPSGCCLLLVDFAKSKEILFPGNDVAVFLYGKNLFGLPQTKMYRVFDKLLGLLQTV